MQSVEILIQFPFVGRNFFCIQHTACSGAHSNGERHCCVARTPFSHLFLAGLFFWQTQLNGSNWGSGHAKNEHDFVEHGKVLRIMTLNFRRINHSHRAMVLLFHLLSLAGGRTMVNMPIGGSSSSHAIVLAAVGRYASNLESQTEHK